MENPDLLSQEDNSGPTEKLSASLNELNKSLAATVSLKRNFLIALLRGIGYTLGATIIAGIIGAFIVKYFPFLEKLGAKYLEQ